MCGYSVVRPFPKDKKCPRCNNFLSSLYDNIESEVKTQPKEFITKTSTVSSKLQGKVKVKKKEQDIPIEGGKIKLKKGEYIKLIGVTTLNRIPLYYSNLKYVYFLELTNNLDFIATSILSGELDKMALVSQDTGQIEKIQFNVKEGIIYLVYGVFPDKKGKWILEQMQKHFSELIKGKNVDNLPKLEKHQIKSKFDGIIKFILKEYLKLQDVFSDQDIPYVEDKLKILYFGLSSRSIGVISLLFEGELNIDIPGNFEDPNEIADMKESLLTAKIEAIAANTLGNTGAMPRWIAVKLGFQNYRFLTFQALENHYYASYLSEGNLGKLDRVEQEIEPILNHVTDTPFSGNLKPFNRLRLTILDKLIKSREF